MQALQMTPQQFDDYIKSLLTAKNFDVLSGKPSVENPDAHREWIAKRKLGLGGSDAAALAGLNKRRSPMDVYIDKLGFTEGAFPVTAPMAVGTMQEPFVRALYSYMHGVTVEVPNEILFHPDYDFILGNVDGIVRDPIGGDYGLEIKVSRGYPLSDWGESGTDKVPAVYAMQCYHYMLVTGFKRWDLAALLSGTDFRVYTLWRDEEVMEYLLNIEKDFWYNHIVAKVPPEFDGSDATRKLLDNRFPTSDNYEITSKAGDDISGWVEVYRANSEKLDEAENRVALCKNNIKALMGDASVIRGDDFNVFWKNDKDGQTIDWPAIAAELAGGVVSEEIIAKHTTVKKGTKRFTIKLFETEK